MAEPFVTVCLATISGRIASAGRVVRSLLDQDYPDFAVALYLSREPFLLDEGVGELPPDLAAIADPRLSIRRVANLGSYRKILPFLLAHRGGGRLVATADDDTVYPRDWLAGLVAAHRRHRCVVCYRGHFMARRDRRFQPYRRWMTHGIERNPDLFILPTGKDGVLYDTRHFHPAVTNHARALRLAPTADDLWLKWHTAAMDVPVFAIHRDYRETSFEDSGDAGLYASYNRAGGNDETVRRLEAYANCTLDFDLAGRC